MRLVAYLRVSGRSQADDGHGLETQERNIRSWAAVHGHEIVSFHADPGVSGTIHALARPAFLAAFNLIQSAEAEGFVAARMDRIGRDSDVLKQALALFRDLEIPAFTAEAGRIDASLKPIAKFLRHMDGGLVELNKNQFVERLAEAKEAKRQNNPLGHFDGNYAYGKHPRRPREKKTVVLIHTLANDEGLSWRGIARELDRRRIKTRKGTPWNHQTVKAILTRSCLDSVSQEA